NVLVIHSELGVLRGGGENFTRNLFSAFVRRGHGVSAVFTAGRRGDHPVPVPPGIKPLPIVGYWAPTAGQDALSRLGQGIAPGTALRARPEYLEEAVGWRGFRWQSPRFQARLQRVLSDRWGDFDAIYVHCDCELAERVAERRPTVLRLPGPVSPELAPRLRKIHAVCANGDALKKIQTFLDGHAT